jgi:endonuclease/exonuclease/phosphatase family metal-dependent hydrolase
MITHDQYPPNVAADIVRLRRRLDDPLGGIPGKVTERNVLIATWNIREFGRLFESYEENPHSPKRNLRGMACIAEVIRRFDVVAIQEVQRSTDCLRFLMKEFLGPSWEVVVSDVTVGPKGQERLAYLYDRRRVVPSGLVGEIVLPPTVMGEPVEQFDRTPYICGFQAGGERFSLLTAHIRFGNDPGDRLPELQRLAAFTAREIRDRARDEGAEEQNLIVLGDFNIDLRGDNPLFQAFVETGLFVPAQLRGLKTTSGKTEKFFDQIAWFQGPDFGLKFSDRAGVVNFVGAIYPELTTSQLSFRVSDHFALWSEFLIDRSNEQLARVLGLDPAMPDVLSAVPELP